MNGQPLPVKHGFPIRIVVPGVSGVSLMFLAFILMYLLDTLIWSIQLSTGFSLDMLIPTR